MFNFIKTNKPENTNNGVEMEQLLETNSSLLEENRLLSIKVTWLKEELGEFKNINKT